MNSTIEDYFAQDEHDRTKIRKDVASSIKKDEQILEVLAIASDNQYRETYCGAIDLLAEIDDIYLFRGVVDQCLTNDDWAEILLQSIACAHKIGAMDRLNLLNRALPELKSRIAKTALIDALENLSDEVSSEILKRSIEQFLGDKDPYVSNYAAMALGDI